ncbi:MAG: hypothetical protein U0790_10625 [Isosphaeraceae bacterium]
MDITLDQALRAESEGAADRPESLSRARECEAWLKARLADGEREAREVIEEASAEGFSAGQVRMARQRMGIVPRRAGYGGDGGWCWSLPDSPGTRQGPSAA